MKFPFNVESEWPKAPDEPGGWIEALWIIILPAIVSLVLLVGMIVALVKG